MRGDRVVGAAVSYPGSGAAWGVPAEGERGPHPLRQAAGLVTLVSIATDAERSASPRVGERDPAARRSEPPWAPASRPRSRPAQSGAIRVPAGQGRHAARRQVRLPLRQRLAYAFLLTFG